MPIPPYNPVHVNTYGLGSSRFARRYSGNRKNLLPDHNGTRIATSSVDQKESSVYCFLFLLVLRCFTSQGTLLHTQVTAEKQWGFPIRKSPDRRLIGTSPKLIAAI